MAGPWTDEFQAGMHCQGDTPSPPSASPQVPPADSQGLPVFQVTEETIKAQVIRITNLESRNQEERQLLMNQMQQNIDSTRRNDEYNSNNLWAAVSRATEISNGCMERQLEITTHVHSMEVLYNNLEEKGEHRST